MSLQPVPKPANSGASKIALINTQRAYVNVRSGPSTDYDILGSIRDYSVVVYFPQSQNTDGWIWVEYRGLRGWVYTGVASFESAVASLPDTKIVTPYDGKVGIWHWKGSAVAETTMNELAKRIKSKAPHLQQIWVKTSDGIYWQGRYDTGPMSVTGVDRVDQWVKVLEQNGLEFHAWCVLHGEDIDREAQLVIEACKRPGVKSMILDVEPYSGYWSGGREPIRPLMLKIRKAVGTRFHIGLGIDPRRAHYHTIFPDEWYPFIDSVHPMCYWESFQRPVDEVLAEVYSVWGGYGKPIIPILQGNAKAEDQDAAFNLVVNRYGARGVSWWRYDVLPDWKVANRIVPFVADPSQPSTEPTANFGEEVIISPSSKDFRSGTYTNKNEFQRFKGRFGWDVLFKQSTVSASEVWVEWKTQLPVSGRYEISVLIPTKKATTKRARYKIHGIKGTKTEVVIDLDQSRYHNQWVSLGIFDLVKEQPNAGKVFMNDVTGEPNRLIAFDAVRWRRFIDVPGGNGNVTVDGVFVADGFDSPVGTQAQRSGIDVPPKGWLDANPFGREYRVGSSNPSIHTGADLNWGRSPNDDMGLPVYSAANGVVTFAGSLPVWGKVVVIRHDPLYSPFGQVVFSRSAHLETITVQVGDRLKRGDVIGSVGDAEGRYAAHLHYDISPTTILDSRPQDWPGMNRAYLLKHYVDPIQFIRTHRPK